MSKGSTGGKIVIEEEIEDDKGQVTKQLNKSIKAINIESRIIVEEDFYEVDEDEDDTSNMSMAVDDDDVNTKQQPDHLNDTNNDEKIKGAASKPDENGSEALDLSFIPCSIPLKKRKISSLPNNNQNEERIKSDYQSQHHHQHNNEHRQHQQFNQKIVTKDLVATIPATSAFNQLTNNRLNSFSLQSKHNHFPFTLRATPSATSSSSSSINNCKPLSLVKNQQEPFTQPHQHHPYTHHQHQLQLQQLQHLNQQHYHHQQQHQKYLQYQQQQQQQQQLKLQDFSLGNKSTTVGSSTSGQTKGMSCRRPGFITCSICNATKYYSHVQRRFGQYSCEPCSKFMKRFLRDPKIFTCSQKGHCTIGKPSGEQEPRGVSVNRCKACWLKICLEKFILDSETRLAIDKYYAPKFSDSSGSSLGTNDIGDGSERGGGDGESEGGVNSECNNNLSTSSGSIGGCGGEKGVGGGFGGETGESKEAIRLLHGGECGGGEGEGRTGKSSNNQSGLSERIESNGCDTTISPPPLPFPQRKRKPKNETSTLSSSSSSSSSFTSTLSSSTQVTTTTTTPGNLINNNNGSTHPGESIPLSTSLSGNNNRIKDKHHPQYQSHHNHHHPLHHSHQNQQYHSSSLYGGHHSSTVLGGGGGHLLTEPLCLTTSGRRSDLSSSGLLGNFTSNSRSSFLPGSGHLSLSHASLGPRYPWSHRRKDDYDLIAPSTAISSLTTSINFRRDLTRPFNHDNLIIRRGSDDDLNDLYSGDYSLTSPELLLSGPYVGVSHIIKDSNGDGDDNVTVMGSPATPPPPPARCGKCTYCLPTIDEKANVVVVKENVGPVRCRLAEMMSKISQTNDKGGGGNDGNHDDHEGGVTTTTTISTTTTTSIAKGHNSEDIVHSSTPNLTNNKSAGRRNRKERRSRGGGVLMDKEESESGSINTTSNPIDVTFHRKRLVSGEDDDNVQSVSIKYLNHDENHHGHHNNHYNNNHHQGNRSSSSPSSSSTTTATINNIKLNKSDMFNAKPYKKILINEHFVNSSPTINNQSTSNSVINSINPLLSRDLSGPIISPDSNFLSEILNANSPFL